MNNLVFLNKETYETLYEKNFTNKTKEQEEAFFQTVIQLVKDMDQLDGKNSEFIAIKLDSGRNIFYCKSLETKFSVLILSEKNSYKKQTLLEISRSMLNGYIHFTNTQENSNILKNNKPMPMNNINIKKLAKSAIEQITYKFIDNLKKNKLFTKFVYFNYNTNVVNSIYYKKSKADSTSVILYNTNKDSEKV